MESGKSRAVNLMTQVYSNRDAYRERSPSIVGKQKIVYNVYHDSYFIKNKNSRHEKNKIYASHSSSECQCAFTMVL